MVPQCLSDKMSWWQNVEVKKCRVAKTLWCQKNKRCQNVVLAKCCVAQMLCCQNILLPNCLAAKMLCCQNDCCRFVVCQIVECHPVGEPPGDLVNPSTQSPNLPVRPHQSTIDVLCGTHWGCSNDLYNSWTRWMSLRHHVVRE